jgi:hypothetical protein
MAHGGCQTPYLARQCLRGKFQVTDPAKVQDLRLTLRYHGGIVVSLNGKELTRSHVPNGVLRENTLASAYLLEAFVTASGDLLAQEGTYIAPGKHAGKPDPDSAKRIATRIRSLSDWAIPSSALRPGINVLAVEIIRAPYHEVLLETREQAAGKNRHNKYDWATCQLQDLSLTAAGSDGLVANSRRPPGLQVWNSDPLAGVGSLDYGDPCEPLRPVRLVAARNGVFSGQVVVGSTKPICGLKVVAPPNSGEWRVESGEQGQKLPLNSPLPLSTPHY